MVLLTHPSTLTCSVRGPYCSVTSLYFPCGSPYNRCTCCLLSRFLVSHLVWSVMDTVQYSPFHFHFIISRCMCSKTIPHCALLPYLLSLLMSFFCPSGVTACRNDLWLGPGELITTNLVAISAPHRTTYVSVVADTKERMCVQAEPRQASLLYWSSVPDVHQSIAKHWLPAHAFR